MLARATGFDPLAVSVGMAGIGRGIMAEDWSKLGAGLQDIDSDWAEIEAVLI